MVENFEKRTKIEWMHEIEREICIEKKLSIAWASNLYELKSWSEYVSVDGGRRAVLFTAFATCLFILSIYSFKSHSKYCVQHRIVLVWFGSVCLQCFYSANALENTQIKHCNQCEVEGIQQQRQHQQQQQNK